MKVSKKMNTKILMSPQAGKAQNLGVRLFIFAFFITLFCSALLMFYIQPLLGKILLPKLGGTPQVWNTCMVFFQAMLFAGYLHAHYTGLWLGLRGQAVIHIGLALAALLTLPIGIANLEAPDTAHPILWLMHTLVTSTGIPIFIISSTAPLLQKWFSNTHHPSAQDPYFLYVASNLGSLFALVSYPTLIEPFFDLQQQTKLISAGLIVLVIGLLTCATLFHTHYSQPIAERISEDESTENVSITWQQRLYWLLLSFIPSSLLLSVTTFITTDIAAVPFLWIVPLALYLLTFVIVFAQKPLISHDDATRAQNFLVIFMCTLIFIGLTTGVWIVLILHLLAFFATALVCHGRLVQSRPHSTHLTEFYLWLSLGGLVGGAFNALLAPLMFNQLFEYPLVLILAFLVRPLSSLKSFRRIQNSKLLMIGLIAFFFIVIEIIREKNINSSSLMLALAWLLVIPTALGIIRVKGNPVRFGLGVTVVLISTLLASKVYDTFFHNDANFVSRNFFGIYRVGYDEAKNVNVLKHGTTVHGSQSRNPKLTTLPTTYYHPSGPFGDLFNALRDKFANGNIAIVGLGAGALSCYGTKNSTWIYYEINPLVEEIARNPRYFTYLRDCPPKISVTINDARIGLQTAPNHSYDLIVIDAFSSDAIPTHLLTREALRGYLEKLTPDGVLAIHISNRYLNLEAVVGNLAHDAGLVSRINKNSQASMPISKDGLAYAASLALVARQEKDLGSIATNAGWKNLNFPANQRTWSDDYVNIFSVLK